MPNVTKTLDKALRTLDSTYNQYERVIMDEDYKTASKFFRQAEQDDLTDIEVDKLLKVFVNKFGKRPI